MSNSVRCPCTRCTIRSLTGPAVIITVGLLFLLHEMRGGYFDFGNTYPVILIVIGAVSLAASLAPIEGHIYGPLPAGPASMPPPPPPPTPAPPQNPFPGQEQGQQ